MASPENRFTRLVQLSRRAPGDPATDAMPPGLATRVLARVRAGEREVVAPWAWLSLRAVPVAAAAAVACVFLADGAWTASPADEQRLADALVAQQLLP